MNTFSRWMAPVIGAAGGVGIGFWVALERGGPGDFALGIGVGLVLGTMAGMVVWLIDTSEDWASQRPATTLGWVLAVLAVLTLCFPFLGLVFALPAFLVNRKAEGWSNKLSRLAFGIGVVMAILTVIAFNVPLGK